MKLDKQKKMASNTVYTIAGALVLNGVLQLLVYPNLNRTMGSKGYGTVLYIMAFVNILGPSVGQALNNSRLVLRRSMEVKNGDYNIALLFFSVIGIIGSALMAHSSVGGVTGGLLAALLILLTVFRYYGDVQYRLSLNYRSYFFYYLLCGGGYAAGFALYRVTGLWYLIFLTGEAAALLFVAIRGDIFRCFWERSVYFKAVCSKGSVLVMSYFITNVALNIDRLYLQYALGSDAVTQYYVVSLIGKTLVLFVAPINTIMISYLTKGSKNVSRKQFLSLAGSGFVVSAVFFAMCQIATPIFIRLFYPDLASSTGAIITAANMAQILAMLSAYLFIIVLTFTSEKWQLVLQILHLVTVLLLITWMTGANGIIGFSTALLIANAIRVILVLILGCVGASGILPKQK